MTRYIVVIDETMAGWMTVEWVNANLVGNRTDSVRLIIGSAFSGTAMIRSRQRLHEAGALLRNAHRDLTIEKSAGGGNTAVQLVAEAAEGDILVIGAQSSSCPISSSRDRVVRRVTAHTATPVVVVPEGWTEHAGPVTVGVDGRTAAAALAFAADTAAQQGRRLVLVRAWRLPTATSPSGTVHRDTDRRLREHASELELDDAIRAVSLWHPDLVSRAEMREGPPRHVLLQSSLDSSLIVIGRSHRTPSGTFLRSVTDTLLREGRTPMCVVPTSSVPSLWGTGPTARRAAI